MNLRILLIGDIVGRPGREIVLRSVPMLRLQEQVDVVVANAENAAGGSGLTPSIYQELRKAGVDVVTLGDHAYRRREILPLLSQTDRILRPANYPPDAPGRSWTVVETPQGVPVAVFTLLGRIFMPPVDCPLRAADRVLAEIPSQVRVILVDMHAEATSDKQLLGRFLDGRVSAVLGTHTHVPTADETILPGGTAFQCDVGMTGPHESIIGRRIDRVLESMLTLRPTHFEVASNDVRLHGTIVDVDPATGRATAIRRLCLCQAELPNSVASPANLDQEDG
ncbi:MAG: YmdB family metallophosphoesterase [Thermoguttaceae bacterium]|nr:YmdB family metallophosphoesterase [Thermoguttaceae bacterium]MDW8038849.1 TIGR00282 family metallophosphoesterase [Thermoguttaceae bacterium]